MSADIEERLARLEREVALHRDQIAIRQHIASYSPKVDTTDSLERARLLAELWTEDGVYDIGGRARHEGREAIASAFVETHFDQVGGEGVCHVFGQPYIRIDGDTAIALHHSIVLRPEPATGDEGQRFYPWRVSMNRWELVRAADGRWLAKYRLNRMMQGDPEALAALRVIDELAASEDR